MLQRVVMDSTLKQTKVDYFCDKEMDGYFPNILHYFHRSAQFPAGCDRLMGSFVNRLAQEFP